MKTPERAAPGDYHHLKPLLERLDRPVIVLDESLRTRYCNDAAQKLRTPGGKGPNYETVYDFMPRPQADIVSGKLREVLNSRKPAGLEIEWPTGGEVRRCSINIVPVTDPADSSMFLVTLIDCPGRGAAGWGDDYHLAALPRPPGLGEIFANLDACPLGICIKNLHRFLWVNRTFAETFGLAPRDFIGKRLEEVVFDLQTIFNWRAEDEQVLRTGKPLLDLERSLESGSRRCFRIDKLPYLDHRGRTVAVIAVGIEKEDRAHRGEGLFHLKAAEHALRRIEDLTATLEDRHAKETASPPAGSNASLQAVEKIIAPLLDQLKKTDLPAEGQAYVALIEKNLAKVTDPVTAEISAPIFKLSPTEVQIAQLVRDGKSSKEIASLLNLSKSTIHTHRQHIREKLGLKNTATSLRSHLHTF